MNEYLIEDESSVYEIDPECKIGLELAAGKGLMSSHSKMKYQKEIRKMEKSSQFHQSGCSFRLIKLILFRKLLCDMNCIRPESSGRS